MNILRKTVGFLTAAAIAAGSVIPLAASADSTAAEDVTNENVILLDEQETDVTEETEVAEMPAADDEEEYAEEYAKLHDDPQYGKYLKAKTLYNSLGENDFSALRSVGGTEDGEGMVSLGKYSNNKLVHNSKFDDMDKIYGIDVSYFQYDIDWSKVKNDVDFAIIRVGYRGYGESGDLVLDYKFKENIKEAKAAGLEVGVYFYTQAITPAEAREEADYVYKYIKNYELELPVYFDIESVDWDSGRLDNADLTVAERTKLCRAFCNRMISYGYESGVYANMNWLNNLIDGELLGSCIIGNTGGFERFEVFEIAMNNAPGVERGCCLFDAEKDRSHGFYCGEPGIKELAASLRKMLPVYMVPGVLHKLDSMPVTSRGKIDRGLMRKSLS